MRVYWRNGALVIEPESEREGSLLSEAVANLKFGRPPEMQNGISGGSTLSGEDLFDRIVGDHEAIPSGLSGKSNDEQHVIAINMRR
jgi:hypothetical protein